MLDRVDAGEHSVAGGLVAVAVAGDLLAQAVGLVARAVISARVSWGVSTSSASDKTPPRRAKLDHVGSVLDLVADGLAKLIRATGDPFGLVALGKQVMTEAVAYRRARRWLRAHGHRPASSGPGRLPWRSSFAGRRRASLLSRRREPS